MTNKIIIDGIDVSECIHISNFENVLFVCAETGRKCELSKNCYYKQLKRKEQECERLKKENEKLAIKYMQNDEVSTFFNTPIEGWSDNPCDICESKQEYEKLQQENEELKEKIKAYQEDRFCQGGCAIYQYDKIHKLTQTLDEIFEIANTDCGYCKNLKCPRMGSILDIINKAREE